MAGGRTPSSRPSCPAIEPFTGAKSLTRVPFVILAAALVLLLAYALAPPAQAARIPGDWGPNPSGEILSTSGATYDANTGEVTFTAVGQSVVIDAGNTGGFSLGVAGTWSGVIQVQSSDKPASGFAATSASPASAELVSSPDVTANGQYFGNPKGRYLKLTATSWTSGQAVVTPLLHAQRFPARFAQNFGEVSATPAVTASSAYASGNWVGPLMTFSNAALTAAGGGRVEEVTVYAKSSQTSPLDFYWCGATPPSVTTVTDKAAVAVAAADFAKCRLVASLTNWKSLGTPSQATSGQIAAPFSLASGTTGYGFLVAQGAFTFASASDLQVTLRLGR